MVKNSISDPKVLIIDRVEEVVTKQKLA